MIYVGCCGFSESQAKYFKDYKTIEIQQTFYKLIKENLAKKWREKAPKDFVFNLKVFQAITHPTRSPTWKRSGFSKTELDKLKDKVGYLRPTKENFKFWMEFLKIAEILEARVLVIQLPASFRDEEENWKDAEKFFETIERKDFILGVELRGWEEKSIRKFCRKFEVVDICDLMIRNPTYLSKKKIGYFRLHGSYEGKRINYKYKYSDKDLKSLKGKVRKIKAKECFVMFNNVYMRDDSKRFIRLLK